MSEKLANQEWNEMHGIKNAVNSKLHLLNTKHIEDTLSAINEGARLIAERGQFESESSSVEAHLLRDIGGGVHSRETLTLFAMQNRYDVEECVAAVGHLDWAGLITVELKEFESHAGSPIGGWTYKRTDLGDAVALILASRAAKRAINE